MKILIIDVETTGLSPKKGQIVELGITSLDTETGDVEDVYSALAWDGKPFDENAWIFSNSDLTVEMVKSAPPLNVERVQAIISQYPLTAFNRRFDYSFLTACGIKIPYKHECIMALAKKKLGWSFNPSVVKAYRNLITDGYEEAHRAMQDARDEARILFECLKD